MATEKTTKLSTCVGRVQVTVEIDTGQPWGADCNLQQVFDQAKREVIERLHKQFKQYEMRVIGEPIVTAILVTEQR